MTISSPNGTATAEAFANIGFTKYADGTHCGTEGERDFGGKFIPGGHPFSRVTWVK